MCRPLSRRQLGPRQVLVDRTLLATSAMLAERGYVTARGKPFSAAQVKRLVEA
jgi:hypothetical protein